MMMTGIYEYNIRCEMIVELLQARKLTVEFRYIYMFLVSEIVSENISGPINDIRTFCESQQTNWNVWDEEA